MKPQFITRRSSSRTRRILRRVVQWLVGLSIAALLVDAFLVDGWLVPSVVSSGSMAPALFGPHREARCQACGMPLVCDAEALTVDSLTCPNCGAANNPLDPRTIPGDRLLIDRATLGVRSPRRWEVVVFHCPSHAHDSCVKRVVGLPGETVEVRDGDVYIDGRIARKTLDEQRAMAQLVYDSAYRDPHLPPRWQAAVSGSAWHTTVNGVWRHTPPAGDRPGPIDWLTYIHRSRVPGSSEPIEETPVRDDDPYNPGTSRRLNDVTDLMLVARLRLSGAGPLWLQASDGQEVFQLKIEPKSGAVALERDGRIVATDHVAARLLDRPIELIFSNFDKRILLAIDGETAFEFDYDRPSGPLHPTARPLAIGAVDSPITIERLQVYRDIYYTPPVHPVASLARRLGPDEFFVLGDNSPISVDSRSWMGGETVPRRLLVGRVLRRP